MDTDILIAIAIVIAGLLVAVAIHWYIYKNYHYICLECSNPFKPRSFLQSFFGLNLFNKRGLICTNCKSFVSARMRRDKHSR